MCATAGLACAFGGIWTVDAHIGALAGLSVASLPMRLFALGVYAFATAFVVALAKTWSNASSRKRAAFFVFSSLLCLAIAAGSAIALILNVNAAPSGLCGIGVRLIGAPMTIGLAYCFATIPRDFVAKASLIGISGAFVIRAVLTWFCEGLALSPLVAIALAFLLDAVSIACSAHLIRTTRTPESSAEAERGLSLRATFSAPLVIVLVSTAAMLGFVRTGMHDAVAFQSSFVIVVALVAFCLIAALRNALLNLSRMLVVGLVCIAAGFLIGPLAEPFAPGAEATLLGLGSPIFEAVAWGLCANAARMSRNSLVAASLARLAVVAGHLAGALIAVGAASITGADTGSLQAGSLVIVFIYFLLALLLGRTSTETAAATGATTEGAAASHAEIAAEEAAELMEMPIAAEASLTAEQAESPEDARKRAVSQVASAFGLTARETDVIELLAQGRDIATIEKELCISRNTAKMHIRHVYQKLDVHSKQEVIDLVAAKLSDE